MRSVLEIIRLEESPEGTFGVLRCDKSVLCLTLELRDLENRQNVSSIPRQQYDVARVVSPKFGETFEVLDVPGRSNVLFHAGNTAADTKGCILLGTSWGSVGGQRAVLGSREAFGRLSASLAGQDRAHLTVLEQY